MRSYFKHVIIWSAGQPKYVDAIVDCLFPFEDFQPLIIYNYNHCIINDGDIYKPLDMLYNDKTIKGLVNPQSTFVIDDRDDTFSKNKYNGILIPAYKITPNEKSIMKEDRALLDLEEWFSRKDVAESRDIRNLD